MKNGGEELEFVLMGSDGIFDRLTNEEIGTMAWRVIHKYENNPRISIHQICGKIADEVII